MDTIRLQATIGGFAATAGAKAVTVLGEMDLATSALLVDICRDVPPGTLQPRVQDCAVVTNDERQEDRDALFTPADIRDGIEAFYDFCGRGLLALDGDLARYDPTNQIEVDGIDERGRKYRFGQSVNNGHIAVIALAWFAVRQVAQQKAADAWQPFSEAQGIYSVGLGSRADPLGRSIMGGAVKLGADGWPL